MYSQNIDPQKTKSYNFEINSFVSEICFLKLIKISLVITPSATNVEKGFLVLTLLSTELRNVLVQKSLEKLMQLISLEPHFF